MSLRLRLAVWYGVLTGLVVLVVGLLTYAEHTRAHYDDLDQVVVATTRHVASEVEAPAAAGTAGTVLAVNLTPGMVLRLYDSDGRLVAAPPDAPAAPDVDLRRLLAEGSAQPFDALAALAPSPMGIDPRPGHLGLVDGPGRVRWRLYALPLGSSGQYLVAAASLDRIDAAIDGFRRLVLLLTLGGAAVTLLAGWLLAGGALRPVALLTDTAATIARSRRFNQRVPAGRDRDDEMGRLATTFNAMLDSLEQAYRLQQRFVADASHELRAPLTAIQANLDLLEHQPDLSEAERREAVGEASREASRLARLVADLLALARADAGMAITRQRVELDRVLLEALGEARHLATGQHLEIAALEPVLTSGDPDRLKQLFLILLDNALKYTPADGRVTLALRRDGQVAEVVIRDTGIGIPPEDLPRVFERFYRADPARSRDPGGTGLGLAIARWIAEQHGGEIRLTGAVGAGTRVCVRLPLPTGSAA